MAVPVAPEHSGDAPYAMRWIARRRNGGRRFRHRLHVRDQQRLRAGVEQALEHDGIVPDRTHERRNPCPVQDAELIDDTADVDRRVLGVDEHPVRPPVGEQLDYGRAARLAPQAD